MNKFQLYSEEENNIINHSTGIMSKLLVKFNDQDVLDSMSIDKTDSVLRMVKEGMDLVNKMSSNRIRVESMKTDSDDRNRLMNILTNRGLRGSIKVQRDPSDLVITDTGMESIVEGTIVRGELSVGVNQMNEEMLELEKEVKW